ncbi:Proteasome assembly chaperone 3 [Madurella mycetomatis]|uniref:Proteasome assembly chaperone 3 n=1 Tax=Madurella mycetomatis TaxID=100816 RepID=A0A175VQK2_9PEZI|nr:Proteasome assembly chaperone 3 [Madurella mycetomatis]
MNGGDGVLAEPFPAPLKKATGTVNGVPTEVESLNFSDKIMITVSQGGRLAQWIQVPLSAPSSASVDMALPAAGSSALPSNHLTPKTLVGVGGEERETLGHLYASQIASHLALRDPNERRTLLLGLGLEKVEGGGEAFFDLLELVQQIL